MSDRLMCCETSAHASDCPNNPNSLGFDEPGLWMVDEWIDEGVVGAMHKPSDADLIAEIRSRVESGTIKGEVVETENCGREPNCTCPGFIEHWTRPGTYLLIGPVSDRGEE